MDSSYKMPSKSINSVMAIRAICACTFGLMAVHTTGHRNLFGAIHLFHLFDLAVTIGARCTFTEMGAMTKKDIGWNFIDAPPFDLTVFFGVGRELLYFRAVGFDIRMALHTGGRSRQAHSLAGIRIFMTRRAFQVLLACVQFMTERNRLLWARQRLLFGLCDNSDDTGREDATKLE